LFSKIFSAHPLPANALNGPELRTPLLVPGQLIYLGLPSRQRWGLEAKMKKPKAETTKTRHDEPPMPRPTAEPAKPNKPVSQGVIPSRPGISWTVIRVKPDVEGSLRELAAEMKPGEFKDCALTEIPSDLLQDQTHKFECAGVFRAAEDGMLGVALGYKD
jgi:hypothetical protein